MEQSSRAKPGDGAVIYQSTFLTMDPRRPGAEAVIVKDGVIVDVGGIDDLVQAYPGAAFDEEFLRKILLPAFVDARLAANARGVLEVPCNGGLLTEDILSEGAGGAPVRVVTTGAAALAATIEAVRRIPENAAVGRVSVEVRGAIDTEAAHLVTSLGAPLMLSDRAETEFCAPASGSGALAPSEVTPVIEGIIAISPSNGDFILAASSLVREGGSVRLSPQEALQAITIDAAYAIGAETKRGSISPGKSAAFAVLDRNPLATPADAWGAITVEIVDLAGPV
jgi:hypothetical protein